jgi:hypothetical protein
MSCYNYNCRYDCCDINGNCPYYRANCYYYYENTALTAGSIVGIVIGAICYIGFIVLALYFCRRMRRRHEEEFYGPPQSGPVYDHPPPPPHDGWGPSHNEPHYGPPPPPPGQPANVQMYDQVGRPIYYN